MTIIYDSSTTTYDDPLVTYEGSSGASTGWLFTPPNVAFVPPILPEYHPGNDLFRHYANRERGVNVWVLSSGEVVQSDPTPENSNTDMSNVFPWNVTYPTDPYVRSIYISPGANPQIPTEHDTYHAASVVAYFAGGSSYPVTTAMYTLLLNYTAYGLGYADDLTPYA